MVEQDFISEYEHDIVNITIQCPNCRKMVKVKETEKLRVLDCNVDIKLLEDLK